MGSESLFLSLCEEDSLPAIWIIPSYDIIDKLPLEVSMMWTNKAEGGKGEKVNLDIRPKRLRFT
jgi:hypothetical protein